MANEKSDITLITSRYASTAPLRLMLARDPQSKKPLWNTSYARPLAPQQFTEAGFASKPPEQELIISQGDFSAGFGKLITDPADSSVEGKRYGCAVGVDCRIPGKAILGPLVNESLMGYTSDNDGFEIGGAGNLPTGWVSATDPDVFTCSAAQAHGGTYSGLKDTNFTADTLTVYRVVAPYAGLAGLTVTLTIWVKCAVGLAQARIEDGVGATAGTANTTTGWEQLTVTHVVDASATRLWYGVELAGVPCYIDDATFTISLVNRAAVVFAELGGSLYMADTNCVYRWDTTLNLWVLRYYSSNTITDMMSFGDVNAKTMLVIACGASADYVYTEDGTTFTADPGGDDANFFTFENQNIWKAENSNEVKSADDAIANPSDFSAAVKVGDQQYNFTEAINHLGRAYFGKANGFFTLSAAGVVTELIPMRSTPSTDNFEQSHSSGVDQRLYLPVGQNGLLYYDDGEKDTCAPAKYGPAFGDFLGQIRALASDNNWNYAVTAPVGSTYATANYSIVWAMRRDAIDGDVDYRWHPIAEVKIDDVRCAWVSGLLTNPRLWIAGRHTVSSNENKPKYLILSRYLSPLDDSNCRYCASGILVTPYYTANFNIVNKAFHYFTLLSQSLSTGHYTITVEYQLDGDSSWTDVNQSTNGTFVTSPSETKYFSNAPASTSVSGKKIRFKFTFATDAAATTPILNSFGLVCRLMSLELKLFDFTIRCVDRDTGKDGEELKHTAAAISTELHAISQDTYPITLIDIWGTTYYVDFVAPYPSEDMKGLAEDNEHQESEIRCLALEAKVA